MIAALLSIGANDASAQAGRSNFEWIELSAGTAFGRSIAGYDGWSSSPAPFVIGSTPYLGGRAELGAVGRVWKSRRPDLPSFTAIFIFAGWAPDREVSERLSVTAGVRAGNHLMVFRTNQLASQRVESEFAVEPHVGGSIRTGDRMRISLQAGLLRVFTAPRLDDFLLRAGLTWRFDAPPGLRRFLQ